MRRACSGRYREAAQKEGGNLRCEVIQLIDQPHQFVVLEIWIGLHLCGYSTHHSE